MKKAKYFIAWAFLWLIAYYFGEVERSAYDNVWNELDLIAISSALFGMYSFYRGTVV